MLNVRVKSKSVGCLGFDADDYINEIVDLGVYYIVIGERRPPSEQI